MQIRPLKPADLDLIDEIDGTISADRYLFVERAAEGLAGSFRIDEREYGTPKIESNPIDDDLRFTMKQVATGIEDGTAFVAEHDDVPIGAVLATKTPDGGVVELIDVRVDFDRRRDGLGSALIFQVINYARGLEARAIRATTPCTNQPAAALLAKLGFELGGLDTFRESNHDLVKERTTLVWYLPLV